MLAGKNLIWDQAYIAFGRVDGIWGKWGGNKGAIERAIEGDISIDRTLLWLRAYSAAVK